MTHEPSDRAKELLAKIDRGGEQVVPIAESLNREQMNHETLKVQCQVSEGLKKLISDEGTYDAYMHEGELYVKPIMPIENIKLSFTIKNATFAELIASL